MTIGHGFSSILGIGDEGTFGTAVAATQKICFISETLSEQIKEVLDSSICGTPVRGVGQPGTHEVGGGYIHPVRVDMGLINFQKFFGTVTPDTPNVNEDTYSLDANIDGEGYTIAIDKQVSVYEFAGFKASTMTVTGTPADGCRVAWTGFATSKSAVPVNTSGGLTALTEPGTFFLFQDVTLRVGDLADALQASDALEIDSFTLEINRALQAVEVNSNYRTEALENNFRETTLKFKVPRYSSDFFVDAHEAHTLLQADLTMTNGTAFKTFNMPKMVVTEYKNNVSGPGFLTVDVTLMVHADPEAENAFMTLVDDTSEIEMVEG